MLRTNPEERPQDPAAFAEKIHACLQKAERQTAFTRSFAPAAIPTTIPIQEKKRIAPALALAAAIVVLASFGAFYLVRSQREAKPLGVIIGVPETAEGSSLPVTASASPSPVINQVAEQPGLVAQQSSTHAALASPSPVINQAADPPGLIAQQSPAQAASSVAQPSDNVSSSSQLAASNNRMAELHLSQQKAHRKPARHQRVASRRLRKKTNRLRLIFPIGPELAAKDSLATTASGRRTAKLFRACHDCQEAQ